MTNPNQQFPVTEPSLSDTLNLWRQNILSALNCVKVGEIRKFDGEAKTAEVRLLFKRVLQGGAVSSHPVLVDCPVFTLQGGGARLAMPVAPGDQCIVLFSDRNLDAWFKTGSEAAPFDGRLHDLSDGIALVGVNALTSSLEETPDDEVILSYEDAQLGLKGGKIKLENAATGLLTVLETLIDTIAAVATEAGGGPLNAASIAALQAQKTALATLLYEDA